MSPLSLLFPIGFQELLVILVIVLVIFGASRIPELGRGLGEGIRNFKKGLSERDGEEEPAATGKSSSGEAEKPSAGETAKPSAGETAKPSAGETAKPSAGETANAAGKAAS